MRNEEEFKESIKNHQLPLVVLDQKWHRLFAVHGKPEEIQDAESEVSGHLARQGKLNDDLKEYKKLKKKLMDNIVANMDAEGNATEIAVKEKKREEDKRLIDELNEKIAACDDELLELPIMIRESNERLMLLCMDYFYSKLRVNQRESKEIGDWIDQVRIDLKKNVIKKQNCDINNREIYAYLHDIFGPDVLDLFDIHYDEDGSPGYDDEPEGDKTQETGVDDSAQDEGKKSKKSGKSGKVKLLGKSRGKKKRGEDGEENFDIGDELEEEKS
ncbi:MAG: hypothetical protein LUI02_07605 [Clostridiales bacterium]|nr:hypothetical protein [Clostridiales bacterium]